MAFGDVLNAASPRPAQKGFGSVLSGTATPKKGGFGSVLGQDLRTTSGLEELAGTTADKITPIGEDPKKIFSGGFISDIFDTMNAIQHGVTGLLKGTSFSEGVKTRQSFSDEDALGDLGLPGVVMGTLLDIAVDPLTYIPVVGAAKAVGKVTKLSEAARAATKVGKQSTLGKKLGGWFVYRFGQDPIYKDIAERSIKAVQKGQRNMMEIMGPMLNLNSKDQKAIAAARKAGKIFADEAPVVSGISKFKNVDEFIGSHTKVFRGGDPIDLARGTKRGISVATTKDVAERFAKTTAKGLPRKAGVIDELFMSPETKIFDPTKALKQDTLENVIESARKQGFDVVDLRKLIDPKLRLLPENEFRILNPGILKTKSELVDLFKQAATKPVETITGLSPELLAKARPAFSALRKLGKESVDLGLLDEATYLENIDTYIARLYKEFESPDVGKKILNTLGLNKLSAHSDRFKVRKDAFGAIFQSKPGAAKTTRKFASAAERDAFLKTVRKDKAAKVLQVFDPLDEVQREAWGEILEAGYPTAKALLQLSSANENAKFFNEIAKKWGVDAAEVGFKQIDKTKRFANLSGKYVPEWIADDINEMVRSTPKGLGSKVMGAFKFQKVILNPATHIRNIMSNFVLNSFEGLNPWRVDIYGAAAKSLKTKDKWFKEAVEQGMDRTSFAANELQEFLIGPQVAGAGKKVKDAFAKIADIYQKEEEYAKMAQFIFQRKRGLNPEKAWEVAERATFNYAQVTPFIRKLRESFFGMPFVTFTYKATPQIAKTAVTKPQKISRVGKAKNNIEKLSDVEVTAEERQNEPFWVRNGFFVKLPWKSKKGESERSAYLDLTYILPFGDLFSGQFTEAGIKRETGLPEGLTEQAASKFPSFNYIKEISNNENFFGDKIWKDTDSTTKQVRDIFTHTAKTFLPPLLADQLPGGYDKKGKRRSGAIVRAADPEQTNTRNLMEELLRNAGLKIQPIDLEMQKFFTEERRKDVLETFLKEQGLISTFDVPFVPK